MLIKTPVIGSVKTFKTNKRTIKLIFHFDDEEILLKRFSGTENKNKKSSKDETECKF